MKRHAASFLAFCLSALSCGVADAQTATTQRVGSIRGPSVSQVCFYRYQSPLICDPFASQNNSTGQITFLNSVIPTPTASALGGVKATACAATNFVNGIGTDGTPTCAVPAGGGGGGSPGGSNGQVQVNNGGSFGGVTPGGDISFNAGTGAFTINNAAVTAAKMAGGAAAGNIGYTPLNPGSNLSDVGSVAAARSNLGLGTIATLGSGAAGDVNGSTWPNLVIANAAVTAAKMASGAAVGNLGYTPANKAGDTFTGPISAPNVSALGININNVAQDSSLALLQTTVGHNAQVLFYDGPSTLKWQVLKDGSNNFRIYDPSVGRDVMNVAPGGVPNFPVGATGITGSGGGETLASATAVASADQTCATNATTGLQTGLNSANPGGTFKFTKGYWCFTQLTLPANTNSYPSLKIECEPGAYLVKIGATGDGIVSGNTLPATFDDLVVRDCIGLTKTGVTPTSGSFWHVKNARHATLDNTWVGTRTLSNGGSTKHSFNAFEFEGVDGVYLKGSGAWGCANDCVRAYGTASSFNASLILNMQIGGATNSAVHVGGGLGGIFCENVDEVLSGTGITVDRSIYNVTNRELFATLQCVLDSNTGRGFYVAPNSLATFRGALWAASNGSDGGAIDQPQDANCGVFLGNALAYGNQTHGFNFLACHIIVDGGDFFNNGLSGAGLGSGILLFGAGVQSAHLTGMSTRGNSAWGVDNQANAGVTSFGTFYAAGNTNAPYRTVNALQAPLLPLPTACGQSGGIRNNGGTVAVC